MQNRDTPKTGQYVKTTTTWGASTTTYVAVPNWQSDHFDFSGFGGGNFKSPTPGRYYKSLSSGWAGKISYPVPGGTETKEGTGIHPGFPVGFSIPAYNFSALQSRCIAKFYDQVRGNADLSVDLFEAGKTAHMLRQAANVTKFVKSLHPNQWAKRWLEYQYGWRPAVNSVYEVYKELHKSATWLGIPVEARVSDERQWVEPFPGLLATSLHVKYHSARVEMKAFFTISNPNILHSLAGYTSLNPFSIAWELVPFSFVGDWFINIGGYLRTLENSLLYANSLKDGYTTTTERRLITSRTSGVSGGSSGYMHCHWQETVKNRTTGIPSLPSLPRFTPKLGWQRLVSAGTLILNHLGRGR